MHSLKTVKISGLIFFYKNDTSGCVDLKLSEREGNNKCLQLIN